MLAGDSMAVRIPSAVITKPEPNLDAEYRAQVDIDGLLAHFQNKVLTL